MPSIRIGYRTHISRGSHLTSTAEDTIDVGRGRIRQVLVTLRSDPVAGCAFVTAAPTGDLVPSESTGREDDKIVIRTWESDLTAATVFAKVVDWVCYHDVVE